MSHPGGDKRQHLPPPFEAYDGNEPFLFASYAHADSAVVYPELVFLRALGYRIWYDEGIVAARDWTEEVADALERCSLLLVFVSPAAMESRNVRNEINFAIRWGKPILPVHIEKTGLPPGLELQIGTTQAILKYRMSLKHYRRKLIQALPPELVAEEEEPPWRRHRFPHVLAPPPPARPGPVLVPSDAKPIITNSIGMQLKLIQPGTFMMGSESGEADQRPVHPVTISKPFYLGVCQVTQAQYQAVIGANPSCFQGRDCPVEFVASEDAQEFCRRLSDKEGAEYRLPTEAEWEYACRAGSTGKYCFGDEEQRLGDYAWYDNNSKHTTHPVGKKNPNAFGLYDMHGNVLEWCEDWYGPYDQKALENPRGPSKAQYRVLRGGSWSGFALDCRCACRLYNTPEDRSLDVGFRVARPLP